MRGGRPAEDDVTHVEHVEDGVQADAVGGLQPDVAGRATASSYRASSTDLEPDGNLQQFHVGGAGSTAS